VHHRIVIVIVAAMGKSGGKAVSHITFGGKISSRPALSRECQIRLSQN